MPKVAKSASAPGTALPAMPEREVQKQCIDLCRLRRVPVFRINAGALPDAKGRLVRLAPAGFSDLLALVPGREPGQPGRWLSVEVKAPGKLKNLTPIQLAFLETIRHAGGIAICVDDVATLASVLDALDADPGARFTIHGELETKGE